MLLPYKKDITMKISGVLGLSAVIMGALGAHALHDPAMQPLLEKASLYQLIHTVALLAICRRTQKNLRCACYCWIVGMILFSGSLYLKAFAVTASAPLAPFGGTLLMLGWVLSYLARVRNVIR